MTYTLYMPLEFRAGVMKVGNGLVVNIPKVICDSFQIKKGDTLVLRVNDDVIEIPLALKKSVGKDKQLQHAR